MRKNRGPSSRTRDAERTAASRSAERARDSRVDAPERAPSGRVRDAILALQRTAGNTAVTGEVAGSPLDTAVRMEMEARLHADLKHVRVHADAAADTRARDAAAIAFTQGANVTFSQGMYRPDLPAGRIVLAHELAHVVQQTRNSGIPSTDAALEAEADGAAIGSAPVVASAPVGSMQRLFGLFEDEEERQVELTELQIRARDDLLIPAVRANSNAWMDLIERPDYSDIFRKDTYLQNALRNDKRFTRWLREGIAPRERTAPTKLQDADEQRRRREEERRVIEETVGPRTPGSRSEVDPIPVVQVAEPRPQEQETRTLPAIEPADTFDWAKAWNRMTPEQRARAAWLAQTTPRERYEASLRGPLPTYIGRIERSLLEFERFMKMVPGARAGVSFAQAMFGEDIIGRPVDRIEAVRRGLFEFAEDLTLVLGPEDLMVNLGPAKRGVGAGADVLEEAAKMTPQMERNIAERGIQLGPDIQEGAAILRSENTTAQTLTREAEQNIAKRGLDLPDVPANKVDVTPFESPLETQSRLGRESHGDWYARKPSETPLPQKTRTEGPLESLGYERPRPREGYFTRAKPRLSTPLDFLRGLSKPELHHFWPQYLKGLPKQSLGELSGLVHDELHASLARWKNGMFDYRRVRPGPRPYESMTPEQVFEELREFYQTADQGRWAEYMPNFERAAEETLRSLGKWPPP